MDSEQDMSEIMLKLKLQRGIPIIILSVISVFSVINSLQNDQRNMLAVAFLGFCVWMIVMSLFNIIVAYANFIVRRADK